jgi:hypothetical protein
MLYKQTSVVSYSSTTGTVRLLSVAYFIDVAFIVVPLSAVLSFFPLLFTSSLANNVHQTRNDQFLDELASDLPTYPPPASLAKLIA